MSIYPELSNVETGVEVVDTEQFIADSHGMSNSMAKYRDTIESCHTLSSWIHIGSKTQDSKNVVLLPLALLLSNVHDFPYLVIICSVPLVALH